MVTVKEFVMQSDHSASWFVCVCVCVYLVGKNRRKKKNLNKNDMNRIQRDCTTGLLTAKADTLVEGISETVSVLA